MDYSFLWEGTVVFTQCSFCESLRISRSTMINWKKKGTSWCSGTLFDFWGAILEKSNSHGKCLPSAKVVHGQQITAFQICDYLWPWYITYSRKIFPCVYVPTFNPMFRMSDF